MSEINETVDGMKGRLNIKEKIIVNGVSKCNLGRRIKKRKRRRRLVSHRMTLSGQVWE